jgi:hypothetical protein
MLDNLPVSPVLLQPLAGALLFLLVLAMIGKVPLKYNLRNLVVRWRITLFTALAFTLVIGLMTGMLAFVNGMYRLTQNSSQPGNVVVLSDGSTDEAFSNLGYSDLTDVERQPGVLRDHGTPLCSREVYLVINQPIPGAALGGRKRRFIQIRGLDDPYLAGRVHNLPLHDGGTWFSEAGVETLPIKREGEAPAEPAESRAGAGGSAGASPSRAVAAFQPKEEAIQAVLGEGIAREFGHDLHKPSLEVGDVFEVGPRKWIVKGILHSTGTTFDSEVWAKRQIVGPMLGKENYSTLVLRTADAAAAKALAVYLKNDFKKAALQPMPEPEYYDKLNGTNLQFLVSISIVVAIISIGGVFGVMNTMYAAISQRIKDIAVLRILGFSRRQILLSFLLESLVLALVGGLLGCAAGSLCNGWTASSIVGSGQGGGKSVVLRLVVDGNILAVGLLLTLAMGALGGLLPALSATRLKPLEALR